MSPRVRRCSPRRKWQLSEFRNRWLRRMTVWSAEEDLLMHRNLEEHTSLRDQSSRRLAHKPRGALLNLPRSPHRTWPSRFWARPRSRFRSESRFAKEKYFGSRRERSISETTRRIYRSRSLCRCCSYWTKDIVAHTVLRNLCRTQMRPSCRFRTYFSEACSSRRHTRCRQRMASNQSKEQRTRYQSTTFR